LKFTDEQKTEKERLEKRLKELDVSGWSVVADTPESYLQSLREVVKASEDIVWKIRTPESMAIN